jgi:hypothetical protein
MRRSHGWTAVSVERTVVGCGVVRMHRPHILRIYIHYNYGGEIMTSTIGSGNLMFGARRLRW